MSSQTVQPRWKKYVARSVFLSIAPEFLGTMLFSFLGGAIVAITGKFMDEAVSAERAMTIAFVDGFLFYSLVYLTMKLSFQTSGYLNPAFSTGLCIVNIYAHFNIWHIVRVLVYIVAQIGGAMVGVVMILAIVPDVMSDLNRTGIAVPQFDEVTAPAAFGVTVVLSVFLMFVILSVRNNEGRMTSLILCFSYIAARLISQPLCGGYLNPARSLAHAVVRGGDRAWQYLWIDMAGTWVGSILAGVLYLVWVRKWRD